MQQIERYGVIALVFLLVTIVAISFWGDSKSPGFWSRLTGKGQAKKEQVAAAPDAAQLPPQIADPALPLTAVAPPAAPLAVPSPSAPAPASSIDLPANGASTLTPPDAIAAGGPAAPGAFLPPAGSILDFAPPGASGATPPPASEPVASGSVHVVQKGDSLARIARTRLGAESRWQEIAALNPGVSPKSLSIGQKLKLPNGASASAPAPRATAKSPAKAPAAKQPGASTAPRSSRSAGVCLVQKGDTLRSIARRELGDERRWKEIAALNAGVDPSRLAIGTRLKLPPSAGGELLAAALPSDAARPRVR